MTVQKTQETLDYIQKSFGNLEKIDQAKIFEEITAAIAAHVRSENNDDDVTDENFYTLGEIAESVQEDFEELVGISNNKKTFIRALTKIFALLLR